jgi:hypothetical protein
VEHGQAHSDVNTSHKLNLSIVMRLVAIYLMNMKRYSKLHEVYCGNARRGMARWTFMTEQAWLSIIVLQSLPSDF